MGTMEQIETQVSDLRYLTSTPGERRAAGLPPLPVVASPASVVSGENLSPAQNHANSADSSGGGAKRKADEEGGEKAGKAQRSKRNRYISIACNECKRRKIKCNGETPCHRCGNLNLQCLYAPNCCSSSFKESDEFRAMTDKVSKLQEQVESLFQNLSALRNETVPRMPPPNDRVVLPLVSPPGPPTVSPSPVLSHGSAFRPELAQPKRNAAPTSVFLPDVTSAANSVGMRPVGSTNDSVSPVGFPDDPHLRHVPSTSQDPLWDVPQDEMLRLCRLHEEELGILLPVVNIQTVTSHAQSLASFMEGGRRRGGALPSLNDERTLLLKAVMCCALAAEDHGNSDRAARLFESTEDEVNRKLMGEAPSVAGLSVLSLVAGYRFLSNDEVLAWRVMGQVARLCLEMGVHTRSGVMKIENEGERQAALTSFWFAYVFDRRWSLGTGLPFVIQDEEIDQVPLPDDHPYLHAMISYSRLGARVSRLVSRFNASPRDPPYVEVEGLDKEIIQWYESTPEEVKVQDWAKEKRMLSTPSYNLQRLRIWTYLRFNQLRIWLYTPFLHTTNSIMNHFPQAQTAVHLATDTLRYLTHLNATTPLYRKLQVFYHQFLPSALATAFLGAVHAPAHFAPACRDDFLASLELVRDLSAKSHVSKRLWSTFSSLRDRTPALRDGVTPYEEVPRRGGAASPFPRDRLRSAPLRGAVEAPPAQSANGVQLQAEMRRVFEAYVAAGQGGQVEVLPALDAMGRYVDGGVYGHFKEMF